MALSVILLLAAAIRLRAFAGFVGLDDAEYARFAMRLVRGTSLLGAYTGPAVFPLRVGVIAPTAAAIRVFGLSEWSLVLYPFVLSLLGIGCAYLCTTRLFGARAGLIAAALLAIFPWDVDGATKLIPDLPAAFYDAIALTALVYASTLSSARRSTLFVAGVVAGVAFGASWLCKESVAYLAPFCLLWMIVTIRARGRPMVALWAGVLAGSLPILLGEMATYHHLTGDALFRFHEIERNYRQWENSFFTEGSSFGWAKHGDYAHALLDRLLISGPRLILLSPTFLFLPLAALVVSAYAWYRGDRAFLLPSLWLWTLVLMFNFSSSSTSAYVPLALFHRYLSPIFFPAIVIVAGFAGTMIFGDGPARRLNTPARSVALLALGGIGLVALRQLASTMRDPERWLTEVRVLSRQITPQTMIYSDALSLRAFEFLHGYPTSTAWRDLSSTSSPSEIAPGSLVLIYPPGIAWLDRNAGMWVAWPAPGPTPTSGYLRGHFSRTPPATWATTWRRGDVVLYRVDSVARTPGLRPVQ